MIVISSAFRDKNPTFPYSISKLVPAKFHQGRFRGIEMKTDRQS